MDKKIIFKLSNVNFWYSKKSKQILKNVNIEFYENETVALIGPSGCGKSTSLKLLNRIHGPSAGNYLEGSVEYLNNDLFSKKSLSDIELKKQVGMIFQQPSVFPLSIYDNVAIGLRNIGIRDKQILDQRVQEALEKAALYDEVKDKLKESADALSGGQKQRLAIARAIALNPKVLLMDEPTSALDPIATQKIENLILELKKDYTIILVTHSMAQAQRVSDKTAFFLDGELIELNDTRSIFTKPLKEQTKDYIMGKIG
ncbi:phosphate ABC transporter ATP-binding protein [Mycoplasmopsis caviae]|uniref:Phosphate ABC transporter ATP-binding protein n=1 Tax=Mycoplasmopsis caviae TaxID=55603 RepID=A0A3P8LAI0_9BACT|nr:phosphate ABC transporter ATP-binding protein [Mycoplasmopsis caviae]UUD35472.1 phosphate ABC transporter ATP-binding protein [Mycoplasmopsis caviae]VDR41751.1 phosphate ABC transporter ATP-binding protein [Mycoplasmopsis caviae]